MFLGPGSERGRGTTSYRTCVRLATAAIRAEYAGQGLTDEQIARIVSLSTPHPGATLTEPAVLKRSIAELPTTYIKCLLDWPEPTETAATLLSNDGWRLVTMDTGHWPMFSQPRELAQILLDTTHA